MKKSLLFMALAAIAVGASAQTFKVKDARRNARVEMKAEPQQLSLQQSTLNTASRIARAPRRVTTEEPTVQAYRPEGFYWFLQNWNGSEAPAGLAIGPSGVENVFTADFSAESSKWVYSTERDGDQFLPQEVDVTESDSTLAVTYEPGFWPTPMAVVSSKVGTKLKNTLVADTAVFASYGLCVGFNSNGVLTNKDDEFVEMGVGNYDPNYYLGSTNTVGVFETNSEEAVTKLTKMFGGEAAGVLSATTLGLGEYYPMNAESEALITSIDATFRNPDAAPTDEDVVAYLMPIVDGSIADPIAAFYLSESVEWQYDDNSHMGHSCHFVPEAPVLVSGDFFVPEYQRLQLRRLLLHRALQRIPSPHDLRPRRDCRLQDRHQQHRHRRPQRYPHLRPPRPPRHGRAERRVHRKRTEGYHVNPTQAREERIFPATNNKQQRGELQHGAPLYFFI